MFKKFKTKVKESDVTSLGETLCLLYNKKLLPLEVNYKFHELISPKLEAAEFTASPMIMFVGQYSTGKTTFIRYLLNQDFPECRIGPEPTTDKFIAIMKGDVAKSIPGNALIVDPKKPFRVLGQFGNAFLNRFSCSEINNELLSNLTIIDTPGVLSGTKQTDLRGYAFTDVIKCLGERVERIFLLFDAHKLDISDEFRIVIQALKSQENKIRIILNKSDRVTYQALMRVYGALMWSLGKIIATPEVTRVFIGSFWEEPYMYDDFKKLFEAEEMDLMNDMLMVPSTCLLRRLSDLIARSKLAVAVAHILSEINSQMPFLFKEKKKAEILENLEGLFNIVSQNHGIPRGDFPQVSMFREKLVNVDFSKLPSMRKKLLDDVESLLQIDLPALVERVANESKVEKPEDSLKGGLFSVSTKDDHMNPFDSNADTKFKHGKMTDDWIIESSKAAYDEIFDSLDPGKGKIPGDIARVHFQKSNLSKFQLMKIWKLSDMDQDGCLDREEFALCSYLIDIHLNGTELPDSLSEGLVPPSKREIFKKSFSK